MVYQLWPVRNWSLCRQWLVDKVFGWTLDGLKAIQARPGPLGCAFGQFATAQVMLDPRVNSFKNPHTHIDDFHTSHHQCLKLEIEWNRYNMIQNRSKLHEIHWLASRLLKLLCFWGNLTDVLIFAHPLEEAGPSIKDGCLKKHTTCVTKAAVTIYYNRNLWQWPKQTESSRFGPVCLRHWLSSNCQIPGVQRF